MIDGLKLRITHSELREHCDARSRYHAGRAEEKQEQLPRLREAIEEIKRAPAATTVSHMNKGGYHLDRDDPVADLERDIRDHKNKAKVFEFFASHLFEEDYTLEETDLQRLEILRR